MDANKVYEIASDEDWDAEAKEAKEAAKSAPAGAPRGKNPPLDSDAGAATGDDRKSPVPAGRVIGRGRGIAVKAALALIAQQKAEAEATKLGLSTATSQMAELKIDSSGNSGNGNNVGEVKTFCFGRGRGRAVFSFNSINDIPPGLPGPANDLSTEEIQPRQHAPARNISTEAGAMAARLRLEAIYQSGNKKLSYARTNLIPPARDLATVIKEKEKFSIVGYDMFYHNRFNIIPTKDLKSRFGMWLCEDMILHWRIADFLLTKPKVGDVVIAGNPVGHNHIRAYVTKMHDGDDDLVIVKDVDKGNIHELHWRKMKKPNEIIVKMPCIGYNVELDGVDSFLPLVFFNTFSTRMEQMKNKTFEAQIVGKTLDGNHKVRLILPDEILSYRQLSTWINELQKWKWETILDIGMCKTDYEIIKSGDWRNVRSYFYNPLIEPDQIFEAEVLGFGGNADEGERTIFLKPIHPYIRSYEITLEAQLERYMSLVKPTAHYPGVAEEFFAKLPEEYGLGEKWLRMLRLDEMDHIFYAVDLHQLVRVNPKDKTVECRRMCPEFFQIPKFIMECSLVTKRPKDVIFDTVFTKTFVKGSKLWFSIMLKDTKDNFEYIMRIRSKAFEENYAEETKKQDDTGTSQSAEA